jgi:polyphenol oxidase
MLHSSISIAPSRVAPLLAEGLSRQPHIRHGFFTRTGGVSKGIYAGLNCGFGSNDQSENVRENRARAARCLNPASTTILTVHQVHSALAVKVDRDLARNDLPKADAAVTTTPGLVIGVLAADCTPVLFSDPVAGVIGAAHAGWRGAVGGILQATVLAMEQSGASRSNIHAAIGPCISQANYEVGPDFEASLVERDLANTAFFARMGSNPRPHFDLPGFVEAELVHLGLAHVERQSPCTYENESLFFSFRRTTHRKEPDYGRQMSAIVLS